MIAMTVIENCSEKRFSPFINWLALFTFALAISFTHDVVASSSSSYMNVVEARRVSWLYFFIDGEHWILWNLSSLSPLPKALKIFHANIYFFSPTTADFSRRHQKKEIKHDGKFSLAHRRDRFSTLIIFQLH